MLSATQLGSVWFLPAWISAYDDDGLYALCPAILPPVHMVVTLAAASYTWSDILLPVPLKKLSALPMQLERHCCLTLH